ncbi:CPBP family intramembrane glutamic endopeptidase [Vibrio ostreae]|uniref:CPBP family intramembrane metalloprotease n=1 Tax=Vibrio ostreae TaxID=2841925 RepID=A0A975YPG6_9VIBR|nr:CPBP family intramembrane glutamic endopeptidase [Vibrio ostreae]QXO18694.1 CPBP family intramembrane metalloprotease [Vibrio ostreae]
MEWIQVSHLWIWALFGLAIIAALMSFYYRTLRPVSLGLMLVTLLSALVSGQITLQALVYSAVGLGGAFLLPRFNRDVKKLAWVFLLLWCTALLLHSVPGFNNILVLDKVHTGPDSLPFTLYLNLDKPLVFFALWLAQSGLLGDHHQRIRPVTWLILPGLLALLPLAWAVGAVQPEWSVPEWLWLFVLNNLLITCVVEEALFRGVIQQWLIKIFGSAGGIVLAGALFGLAHMAGGAMLVLFAALAGTGYGLAYYFSHRLWIAIGFHFLFNLTHLVLFTYPAAAG